MAVLICIWRCVKSREKEQEITARRKEYDAMLSTDGKQLYHVSLIQPLGDIPAEEELVESPKRKLQINIFNNEQNIRPSSEVISGSEISTKSLPRSPLTPRELFFIDLIEAVNNSPAAMIPPTQQFIDNERRNHLPNSEHTNRQKSNSEFFIANVPDRKSLIETEVFLYVEEVPGEKELVVTMENDVEEVFHNN